jgi:hypothetical protein
MRLFFTPARALALLALLVSTFCLYLQPEFLVLLAEQVWACL